MACYYIVISSTHLRDGQLRSIKGVFRGPIGTGSQRSTEDGDSSFYCELCDKQYVRHQQYDNHINSYDHHHKQRLKELKQREFYRALACRKQRKRREERKEERSLRRLHQHEGRSGGECAPGSGPMFRSTTVAVDQTNQSRPELMENWAGLHANTSSLGSKHQNSMIQPFIPLQPTLETRLLRTARWTYEPLNNSTNAATYVINKTQPECSGITAAAIAAPSENSINPSAQTNHFNKLPWAHNYLSNTISANNIPTSDINSTNGSILSAPSSRTDSDGLHCKASGVLSISSRVRPVSFSLPKRSCVLLHQSAAVFIQAGCGLTEKPGVHRIPDRGKDKESRPVCDAGDQRDNEEQSGVDRQGSGEVVVKEIEELSEDISCNPKVRVQDCLTNGTQLSGERGTESHLYFKSGTEEPISEKTVKTKVLKESTMNIDNQTHQLQQSVPNVSIVCEENLLQSKPKDSSSSPLKEFSVSESPSSTRPKEPFCPVLSRDGSRVLLWPSEMVSYTKTSPSISYSVNPLLYDFRAHNKAWQGGDEKKGLEKEQGRIKPSVIKHPNCQPRQGDADGEVKIDEREEADEGGQAGNPMELVAHCSGGDAPLHHDESALEFVSLSAECHLGLQKPAKRKRRKKRGGVRRGMRKRGRRKKRTDVESGKPIISSFLRSQVSEGRTERLKPEGNGTEESAEKGLLSNLVVHRQVGGREEGAEERGINGDQTEPKRAQRNEEKSGELLSNLPVNRCNRCSQLCAQVKREASAHPSQQSASGWGQSLRKILGRGATCDSLICLIPESVTATPCCPAITPGPAKQDTGETVKNTREGQTDEVQRNLREDAKENMCNLMINSDSSPHRDLTCEQGVCLVGSPQGEAAGARAITLSPGFDLSQTACCQRQMLPAEKLNLRAQSPKTDGIRSATDTTLSRDLRRDLSKRKMESAESETTPQKKRKRGRRQLKGGAGFSWQPEACSGLNSIADELCCKCFNEDLTRTRVFLDASCNTTGNKDDDLSKGPSEAVSEETWTEMLPRDEGDGLKDDEDPERTKTHNCHTPVDNLVQSNTSGNSPIDKCSDIKVLIHTTHNSNTQKHNSEDTHIDSSAGLGSAVPGLMEKRQTTDHCEVVRNDVSLKQQQEEEKQSKERMKMKEELEKEWARRKERETEVDFVYPEKRPYFPHPIPPGRIPLHAPLLLPSPISSSSFSFHHTVIQHRLSLLPPHLPVHSFPHLLPSFSSHLHPLSLNPPPPPPPPGFYASPPIPLLDVPPAYPMTTEFHPILSPHPPLYPQPHPAVLPLQVLF